MGWCFAIINGKLAEILKLWGMLMWKEKSIKQKESKR